MHACMHRYMYLQIRCCNCLLTCLFVEDGLTGSAWGDWATTARRAWIFPPTECRVSVFSCCNHHPRRFSIREGQQLRSQAKQQPKKTAGFHSKHCLSFLRHQDDHHSVCRYSLVYTTVDGENTAPPTWHVTIPQLPRTPFLTLVPGLDGAVQDCCRWVRSKDGVFMTMLQRGCGARRHCLHSKRRKISSIHIGLDLTLRLLQLGNRFSVSLFGLIRSSVQDPQPQTR